MTNQLLLRSQPNDAAELSADHAMLTPKVRAYETVLSETDLVACGLLAIEVPRDKRISSMLGLDHPWSGRTRILVRAQSSADFIKSDVSPSIILLPSNDISDRLDELRQIAQEEGASFSESSACSAIAFISTHQTKIPSVFLLGNGNIRLVWESDNGEQVGLQFLESESAQFIVFQKSKDTFDQVLGVKRLESIFSFLVQIGMRRLVA